MPFSATDAEQALVSCGRHCCICHKFCGTKIELHHIIPESKGGSDEFDNCIPVCFDCHAEVQHYNSQHPKGRKFTENELKAHRDRWYEKVATSGSTMASAEHCTMDKALFSKIREMLPSDSDTIYFLRDYDLANSFEIEILTRLHRLEEFCALPEAEFMDAELESLRAHLFAAIDNFLPEVAGNTFPCRGAHGPRRNEIPPEWELTQPMRFKEVRRELNDLATEVYQRYQELIRTGRRRLAVS